MGWAVWCGDILYIDCFAIYREVADRFGAKGLEYFNTFGGNPVSAAIANAVLDVIDNEKLMDHATNLGSFLLKELRQLMKKHSMIGKSLPNSVSHILPDTSDVKKFVMLHTAGKPTIAQENVQSYKPVTYPMIRILNY